MALPLIPIFDVLSKVVDRVIPDPTEKAKLTLELAKLADAENARASQEAMAQSEVNKVEAGHRSIFVAGWRPAVGWVCGGALVYNVIAAPMFHLQVADLGFLQTILLAMLGISASRTVEKIKGVTNDVLPMTRKAAEAITNANPTAPAPKKKVLGVKWPF
jgi:hypothetical protein